MPATRSLLFLVPVLALVACAAPAEDTVSDDGSAMTDDDTPPPFTAHLSLEDDDEPWKQSFTAGKSMTITARDPAVSEVEAQSDMGAATVTVAQLAIRAVPGTQSTVLDVEVRYSSKGHGALDVIRPTSADLGRVLKSGMFYSMTATRKTDGTSKFFNEVDLTFTSK